ncbi:hypothetical protein CAPTEDRAFT_104279 [Capitella teleta]|uniref:G-protein coupled receptors family 1 profile domain-containing protein n=1 Tax=Capitella teleta TaxID=283909 RepID=R7T7U4_CAPTE|nr:hypothetical protein CAPTEDRAFT_104279 [Capitella teleta]|eukprot:ELT89680.1 hypothetical protein CAPTEDRAFT_104279 [Capitella teleta]
MIKATASPVLVVRAAGSETPLPTSNSSTVESPPYWTETESVILAVILGIIMFVAVIGNILVITVVAKNRGMRTRTNIFLCNLAVADLFCSLLDMPLSLVTIVKGDWIFSPTLCQLNGFAVPFFFVASIHTLMYIGIHKYISIRYPLGQVLTRRRVRMMIGSAWLWATIAGYLTLHGLNTVTYKPKTAQCGPAYPSNPWTYSHLCFMVITCYLVPLIILALCYVGMFREIQALSARMEQHTSMEKQLIYVQQRRITLTLLIVLVFFVICWTPHIVYSVSVSVIVDKSQMPRLANPISYWCGYLSSACNPLIYGLMSPAFREGYKELLCSVHQEEIVSDG